MTPVTFLEPYCYWKLFQSEVIYNMSKIRHSEENGLLILVRSMVRIWTQSPRILSTLKDEEDNRELKINHFLVQAQVLISKLEA